MANLSYGSRGDDVRQLQAQLRAAGYDIDVDGSFGPQTQAAVRQYQAANGLSVDGIVGNETRGSLSGSRQTAPSAAVTQGTTVSTSTNTSTSASGSTGAVVQAYKPGASVTAAERYLQQVQGQKPGQYAPSASVQAAQAYLDAQSRPSAAVQAEQAYRDAQSRPGAAVQAVQAYRDARSRPGAVVQAEQAYLDAQGRPGAAVQAAQAYRDAQSRPGEAVQAAQAYLDAQSRPGEAVQAADLYYRQLQEQKPGEYDSPYAKQMAELYDSIRNRKPFEYDLNADLLYKQYRDQYQTLGERAMRDTIGQAAALTGGYGSTYGQRAGQEAYEDYLGRLNDRIPELYNAALNRYIAEGDDLYKRYGLAADADNTAYGRYRDALGDYRADLADAYGRYRDALGDWQNERNYAYDRYNAERGFDYGRYRDTISDWQNERNYASGRYDTERGFDYGAWRDAVADEQWERQFAAAQAARAAGGGSGGGGSTGSKNSSGSNHGSVAILEMGGALDALNRGANYNAVVKALDADVKNGVITSAEKYVIMQNLKNWNIGG